MILNCHPKSLLVRAFHSVQIICARRLQLYPSMAPKQIYKRICKTRFPLLLKDVLPSSETRHRLERTTFCLNLFFSSLSPYLFSQFYFWASDYMINGATQLRFQVYYYNLNYRGCKLPQFKAKNNGYLHFSLFCRVFCYFESFDLYFSSLHRLNILLNTASYTVAL